MQKAAYAAGAIACGISGSGSTMFALVKNKMMQMQLLKQSKISLNSLT